MLSLADYSLKFDGLVTIQSFKKEIIDLEQETNFLKRYEIVLKFIGKLYYLLNSVFKTNQKVMSFKSILQKIDDLRREYKWKENIPKIQAKIREIYINVGVFYIQPTDIDIYELLSCWEAEVSILYEKYSKNKECEICMEDNLEFLFVKCAICSRDICGSCYCKLSIKKCPFCRTKI